jgi:ribosome maturation factor RimP
VAQVKQFTVKPTEFRILIGDIKVQSALKSPRDFGAFLYLATRFYYYSGLYALFLFLEVSLTKQEQQLTELLTPTVEAAGFEHSILRVYIDHQDGITVDHCATVSREVSALLDVEDPIPNEYYLEVSSPGLDRPLFTPAHFAKVVGQIIEVKLAIPADGRRKFKGLLTQIEDDMLVVEVDGKLYRLLMDNVDKANVVPVF